MKLQCTWNEKMTFTAEAGSHAIQMDTKAPVGSDSAMTPKQLVIAGICGCTAMDVVALLKKYKEPLDSLAVEAEVEVTEGIYPAVFKKIHLLFKVKGKVDAQKLKEAITLSQTKYCGVSAMLSKAVPIDYDIDLNGEKIGSGQADFN